MNIITAAISFSVLVVGCASIPYTYTRSEAPNAPPECKYFRTQDPAFKKCREQQLEAERIYHASPEYKLAEEKRIRKEKEEQKRLELAAKAEQAKARAEAEAKRRAMQPGASLETYVRAFGEPDRTDIIDGKQVLWYDSETEPLFVVFSGSKLVSRYLDRDTLRERKENELRENEMKQREIARQQEEARYQQQQRAEAARQFGESIKNALAPPKQTNCVSKRNYLGQVETSCTEN